MASRLWIPRAPPAPVPNGQMVADGLVFRVARFRISMGFGLIADAALSERAPGLRCRPRFRHHAGHVLGVLPVHLAALYRGADLHDRARRAMARDAIVAA